MFNARSIQGILILVTSTFLAIWLGLSVVTNQMETIIKVLLVIVFVTCLFLDRHIWLLIPFATALGISLRIPGQPDTLLLAQFLVIGFSAFLFLMRKLPFLIRWTELEFWMFVLTLFIAQVYMRNPVSVSLFGGTNIGGKGYFLYAIALANTLLFCGLKISARELKWILPLSICGGLMNTAVSIISNYIPIIGYYTGMQYMKATDAGFENTAIDEKAATRMGFLGYLGVNLSLWISSYISPLKACLRPLWAVLVIAAIVTAAMAGFRNTIAAVGLTLLIGIAYRSGIGGVTISIFAGIVGLALLAVVNTLYPLPPNIQRSLTFLPGTWEERYKLDAKASNEWRFEVWREVLTSDRWIQNKLLGDGLGFSATELAAQMGSRLGARAGISGFDTQRESILSSGDYHSGPVSTIRVIGYIGLFFFLIAQIRLAVHAHRQILRCRGTEWLPLALFLGIPMISGPLFFVFIFGDFKGSASAFLLSLGMMRLLENNLPLPAYIVRRREPYQLAKNRPR